MNAEPFAKDIVVLSMTSGFCLCGLVFVVCYYFCDRKRKNIYKKKIIFQDFKVKLPHLKWKYHDFCWRIKYKFWKIFYPSKVKKYNEIVKIISESIKDSLDRELFKNKNYYSEETVNELVKYIIENVSKTRND